MRRRKLICWALLVLGIPLLLAGSVEPVHAQIIKCVTFGQARRLGLFARFNLRPAVLVKNNVEARTGGRVVSFLVCRSRSGPVYQLTVVGPNGGVDNITVPAN